MVLAHILLVVLTVTAAVELSRAAMLVTLKLLPAPARYVPLGACFFMRQIKKGKEKHHVE
jgi:hypothetical protein